jgi:L,D-transpeptidase YcbB
MKWIGVGTILLLLVTVMNFSRCGRHGDAIDTVACPIASVVGRIEIAESYYNKKVQLKTGLLYGANQFRRIWLKKRRPEKLFFAFIDEVKESARYGLDPEAYHIKELENAVDELYDYRRRTNADISALDLRISASFFLFTTHLIEGRVRYPGARDFLWKRGMPLENDIAMLLQIESASDLRKEIERLQPVDPQYGRLQKALKKYRGLQKADTFPPISKRIHIRPGEFHTDVPIVRAKLSLIDGLRIKPDSSGLYDDELVKKVNRFKERHGLKPDSILDAATAAWLNVPLRQKTELIVLNLERLRWLPHIKGEKDEIVINVPEYMLRVYRKNKIKMQMRVVLGSEFNPTPVFHDTLKSIMFSPTWNVPKSIFVNEFYPKLKADPSHFDSRRFRFYKDGVEIDPVLEPWADDSIDLNSYSVIEDPGEANSLGNVKFIMPNDYSIYLHDTPADKLFDLSDRALSHGCIRLEKPLDFAAYLLSDVKGWNKEKIDSAMHGGKPLEVDLEKPYPVYIVYRTVWVDDKHTVHFRHDVYGHDERQLAYLHEKSGYELLSAD